MKVKDLYYKKNFSNLVKIYNKNPIKLEINGNNIPLNDDLDLTIILLNQKLMDKQESFERIIQVTIDFENDIQDIKFYKSIEDDLIIGETIIPYTTNWSNIKSS